MDGAGGGAELRITEASAAARLADLTAGGLLVGERGAPAVYRFSPADSEDVRAVAELAETYANRRVSVITFIFSRPLTRVRGLRGRLPPQEGPGGGAGLSARP